MSFPSLTEEEFVDIIAVASCFEDDNQYQKMAYAFVPEVVRSFYKEWFKSGVKDPVDWYWNRVRIECN